MRPIGTRPERTIEDIQSDAAEAERFWAGWSGRSIVHQRRIRTIIERESHHGRLTMCEQDARAWCAKQSQQRAVVAVGTARWKAIDAQRQALWRVSFTANRRKFVHRETVEQMPPRAIKRRTYAERRASTNNATKWFRLLDSEEAASRRARIIARESESPRLWLLRHDAEVRKFPAMSAGEWFWRCPNLAHRAKRARQPREDIRPAGMSLRRAEQIATAVLR